ncbi:hypothetical protein Tco_0245398 [Tanacetum coccineum]
MEGSTVLASRDVQPQDPDKLGSTSDKVGRAVLFSARNRICVSLNDREEVSRYWCSKVIVSLSSLAPLSFIYLSSCVEMELMLLGAESQQERNCGQDLDSESEFGTSGGLDEEFQIRIVGAVFSVFDLLVLACSFTTEISFELCDSARKQCLLRFSEHQIADLLGWIELWAGKNLVNKISKSRVHPTVSNRRGGSFSMRQIRAASSGRRTVVRNGRAYVYPSIWFRSDSFIVEGNNYRHHRTSVGASSICAKLKVYQLSQHMGGLS